MRAGLVPITKITLSPAPSPDNHGQWTSVLNTHTHTSDTCTHGLMTQLRGCWASCLAAGFGPLPSQSPERRWQLYTVSAGNLLGGGVIQGPRSYTAWSTLHVTCVWGQRGLCWGGEGSSPGRPLSSPLSPHDFERCQPRLSYSGNFSKASLNPHFFLYKPLYSSVIPQGYISLVCDL